MRGEGSTNAHKLVKIAQRTPRVTISFFFDSSSRVLLIRANARAQLVMFAFATRVRVSVYVHSRTTEHRFVLLRSALLDG